MKTYLKIAWRNLWRNTRRTLITSASIFFGIFFAVLMSSMQQGSFENMVDNMVRFYSGYFQFQEEGFKENRSVNQSFIPDDEFISAINSNPLITQSTSRIESFALAASDNNSAGSLLFGIEPANEEAISGLSKWVKEGEFLTPGSKDVLLGKILAQNLNLGVNDTVILIGQGYHGVSTAGVYRIAGLLDFPLPALSRQVIYMEIKNCQEYLDMPGRITSTVIMVANPDDVDKAEQSLSGLAKGNLQLYTWKELQPELINLIEGKEASGVVIKGLLFMIIGFGVWATIIMLMNERKRELGVMIALGMRKTKLFIVVLLESFFIALIGIASGLAVSIPLSTYLFLNPIYVTGKMAETYTSMGFEPVLKFSAQPEIFINPSLVIFIMFAIISLYQLVFIAKLNTVKAMRP